MKGGLILVDKLIAAYIERFNENFPFFLVRHLDESEQKALIQKALDTGKKYEPEPDLDDDAEY